MAKVEIPGAYVASPIIGDTRPLAAYVRDAFEPGTAVAGQSHIVCFSNLMLMRAFENSQFSAADAEEIRLIALDYLDRDFPGERREITNRHTANLRQMFEAGWGNLARTNIREALALVLNAV